MTMHSDSKVWTLELVIDEDARETEAKAMLRVGEWEVGGWGRARRAPTDSDRPRIGSPANRTRPLTKRLDGRVRGGLGCLRYRSRER